MSTSSISIHSSRAVTPLHETQTSSPNSPSKQPHKPFGEALLSSAKIEPPKLRITIGECLGEDAQPTLDKLSSEENILFTPPESSAADMNKNLIRFMQGKNTDLLVIRGNIKVDQNFIKSLKPEDQPKFVLRAGTGMNNIDKNYLTLENIECSNTPSVNTESTAALAFSYMQTLFRGIHLADHAVKNGEWDRTQHTGRTPYGKTLGIVGAGAIGTELARLAKSFNMKVLGLRPRSVPPGQAPTSKSIDRYVDTLEELMPQIDTVSVHVPLTEQTRKMIGKKELDLMPKGSIVINVAREDVIDEKALLDALNSGHISGAGIDVFIEEKEGGVSHSLATHPHVISTPHIGGQTREACEAMGQAVVNQARKMFLERLAYAQSQQSTKH